MKKYIKQIIALALIVSFASCSQDDEKIDMLSAGGSAVAPGSISRLDNNVPISIKVNLKDGVAATKVEIYKNTAAKATLPIVLGDKVADATITAVDNKTATAIYSSSALGSFDVFPVTGTDGTVTLTGTTGTFPLVIKTTFSDGTVTTIPYVQTVAKGIVWKILDADGLPVTNATSGVTSFKLKDHTPVNIRFAAVKKAATTLTSIVGTWSKKAVDGTVTTGDLPGTIDADTKVKTVDIAAIDYATYGGLAAGDVITYIYTVTAGTQTDVISTKITIANQVFGSSLSGSLSSDLTMNQFDLAANKSLANDSSKGEIIFTPSFGFSKAGTARIDFVKGTLSYDDTDLFKAEEAYTAGTKVTSVTDLATNEVVLYKIIRNVNLGTEEKPNFKDVSYYGLLKVGNKTTGSLESFAFTYKEGELKK